MMQITATASFAFPTFDLSEKAKIKLPELLRDMLKKQAKDGVRVTSEGRFPPMPKGGDGKRIDLVDTGALWREVRFSPLMLSFAVPYARFVLSKYAAGLSPRYQLIFEQKALPIIIKGLIVKGRS